MVGQLDLLTVACSDLLLGFFNSASFVTGQVKPGFLVSNWQTTAAEFCLWPKFSTHLMIDACSYRALTVEPI